MSKKPSVATLTAGHASADSLNTIFEDILDALDNTVSRDGSVPNQMEADLDLDSNDLLNVGNLNANKIYVDGIQVIDATYVPNWEGEWVTSTAYVVSDTVRQDGNVYICLVAHTSGTFSTDLTANYWELFASKGSAGAGSGDMIAANNLSDVSDAPTARSNLGLGTVATENTVPVAKGGTGASSASGARTNLGLGGIATTDLIDEDDMVSDTATQAPSQQSVKAYVDSLASPFSESFTSTEQTITAGGGLTLAHSLSAAPSLIQARLVCKTAQWGYSIGDEVITHTHCDAQDASAWGVSVVPDATNINVRYGTSSFPVLNKSTGTRVTITAAYWKFVVKAWA